MVDALLAQFGVLFVSIMLLLAQLWVQKKQIAHILFAIFCASVALSTVKQISGDTLGSYQYLIGMGACATCNVYWLIARTFFREKNPLNHQHVAFALIVAFLIMLSQGHRLVDSVWGISDVANQFNLGVLGELTVMLSSCVLVMSCWEAIRGYHTASSVQKVQRLTFLCMFAGAVAICKIVEIMFPDQPQIKQFAVACVTMTVLVFTQGLLVWISTTKAVWAAENKQLSSAQIEAKQVKVLVSAPTQEAAQSHNLGKNDLELAQRMRAVLIENQQFLQANLKVGDLAREMNLPEYKVSKVLRQHFKAKNFNHFVNELRIEHAKTLLLDADKEKWSILVVGLESGFASVGPFTRAFKTMTGYTPNQYRKEYYQVNTRNCIQSEPQAFSV